MFVGVVIENFHKCRESQEQEEKARREARHAKRLDQKRKSTPTLLYSVSQKNPLKFSGIFSQTDFCPNFTRLL